MKRILLATLALLSACAPAREARNRYQTAYDAGDNRSMCQASGEVIDAYLSAGDADKVRIWKQRQSMTCFLAGLQDRPW